MARKFLIGQGVAELSLSLAGGLITWFGVRLLEPILFGARIDYTLLFVGSAAVCLAVLLLVNYALDQDWTR